MNHLRKFFSSEYQFQIYSALSRSDKYYFAIGILALVLAVVLNVASRMAASPVDKNYRYRLYNAFLMIGLWEVIWFGCRYEGIRFFGSHFVAVVGLVIGAIWLIKVGWDMFRHYTVQKQEWEKEQVRLKYLPK